MIRLLNICVIVALVVAAAYVYKIKFESTRRPSASPSCASTSGASATASRRCARNGRKLDNPARIQELARRHLTLRPVDSQQFDPLDHLPERPPDLAAARRAPIRSAACWSAPTGSVPAPKAAR